MPPSEFYHGTSLEAALAIQRNHFRVDLSGTNAGAMLGTGVYATATLEKAMNYAKPKPHSGAIFKLRVDLGKCKELVANDPMMKTWHRCWIQKEANVWYLRSPKLLGRLERKLANV